MEVGGDHDGIQPAQVNIELRASSEAVKAMSTEMALSHVGGSGCFQKCAASIVATTFTLSGMIMYGLSYLLKGPEFICVDDQPCDQERACAQGYKQASYPIHNWTKTLHLECESEARMGLIGSLYFVGFMLGAIIFLRLSDICGRKPVAIGAYIVHIIVTIMLLAAPNLQTIYAALFLLGLKTSPNGQVTYIQVLQFVTKDKRNGYGVCMMTVDAVHVLLLALYYALVPNYQPLFIYNLMLAIVLLLLYITCVPESPRYYISHKKYKHARTVFNQIANRNKKQMFTDPLEGEPSIASDMDIVEETPQQEEPPKTGILDLFRAGKSTVVPLVIMSINWFIATLVYYGIVFGMQFMTEVDLFKLGIVAAVAELVGVVTSGYWANAIGRKKSIICNHALLGAACAVFQLTVWAGGNTYVLLGAVLVAKYCSTAAFNIIYLMTSELFPTSFRGTVFGLTNFVARIGGIAAPFVDQFMKHTFMLVFVGAAWVSAVISVWLRETKGREIADTLGGGGSAGASARGGAL